MIEGTDPQQIDHEHASHVNLRLGCFSIPEGFLEGCVTYLFTPRNREEANDEVRIQQHISAASPPYAQRDNPYSYSNAGGPLRGLVEAATSSAPSRDYSPLHHSKHDSFLGENSAASFVRGHLGAGGEKRSGRKRAVVTTRWLESEMVAAQE